MSDFRFSFPDRFYFFQDQDTYMSYINNQNLTPKMTLQQSFLVHSTKKNHSYRVDLLLKCENNLFISSSDGLFHLPRIVLMHRRHYGFNINRLLSVFINYILYLCFLTSLSRKLIMTTHFIKGYINQLVKFGAFSTV